MKPREPKPRKKVELRFHWQRKKSKNQLGPEIIEVNNKNRGKPRNVQPEQVKIQTNEQSPHSHVQLENI